jgi:hypothetical protein
MLREILLIVASGTIAYLIMVKSDQQMLILLKGRLHKFDRDPQLAEEIWKRNLAKMPRVLGTIGGATGGLAIIFFTISHWTAVPISLLSALCFGA